MMHPPKTTPGGVAGTLLERVFSARSELAAAVAAGVLLLAGWVAQRALRIEAGGWLVWGSLAIGMVYGGRAAWESLRGLKFDIDVLMVVGAGLAAYIGAPAEGALLLFLFVLAGALEGLALTRTRRAVEALHRLMPTRALVWREGPARAEDGVGQDGQAAAREEARDGTWVEVEPERLAAGERIKVLPGESIPADARVTAGSSAVNQASLTGESVPRVVRPGDEVYAGTINVGNPFEAVVTRPAAESSLQRVLNLVIEAQQQREPIQRVIDRVSQPYALGVMAASAVVLLVWWLVLGDPLLARGADGQATGALYTAITLLVVMSPCAVIIATPTATLAAISRGAKNGVLFKGGQAIERLARMAAVALDKTGTLTIGRPRVQQVHAVGWSDGRALLGVAAGLERESTHPIAAAIREAAERRGVAARAATRATFTPGRGVGGECEGKPAALGTYEHTVDLIPECLRARVAEVLSRVQARGDMATVIAWDGQAAVLVMRDEPRPGAAGLVEGLHALGIRPVVMLTGDNAATAARVAEDLRLDRWRAEMLPEEKMEAVRALRAEVRAERGPWAGVGVIGDGVNDAPALSAADVSIAIGSIGSDAALESADIVLMGEHLGAAPWAVGLARRARRTIAINLAFALAAIGIMAVAAVAGSRVGLTLPLWMGVLGHEGGTLLVVAHSLALLAWPGPPAAEAGRGAAETAGIEPIVQEPVPAEAPRRVSEVH
jgi:Cd2+/Zn2+-exporting ATPase